LLHTTINVINFTSALPAQVAVIDSFRCLATGRYIITFSMQFTCTPAPTSMYVMLYTSAGIQTGTLVAGAPALNYNYGYTTIIATSNYGINGCLIGDLSLNTYYTWGLSYSGTTFQSAGGQVSYTRIG
jgi:hypothetical protein